MKTHSLPFFQTPYISQRTQLKATNNQHGEKRANVIDKPSHANRKQVRLSGSVGLPNNAEQKERPMQRVKVWGGEKQ